MRAWLDENYATLVCLLIFLAFAVVVALGQPVQAAPVDVEDCTPWRQAGQWTMYACEEDWELGVQCIHSDSGFMDCKWED